MRLLRLLASIPAPALLPTLLPTLPPARLSGLLPASLLSSSLASLLAIFAALATPPASAGESGLAVEDTEFVLRLPDGSQRRSADLVGATLEMPSGRVLRIDAVESETTPSGAPLWLHTLSIQADNGEWQAACGPDAFGRRLAVPFPGSFGEDGRYEPAPGLFNLSCSNGAQVKCLRLGYMPWKKHPKGASLIDHYNTCTRMIRADYCGNFEPHTLNGTLIDTWDDIGIGVSDHDPTLRFEAGWNTEGAVCISHVRIPSLPDPRQSPACARQAAAPSGAQCTEQWAREHGALLFNRSR